MSAACRLLLEGIITAILVATAGWRQLSFRHQEGWGPISVLSFDPGVAREHFGLNWWHSPSHFINNYRTLSSEAAHLRSSPVTTADLEEAWLDLQAR